MSGKKVKWKLIRRGGFKHEGKRFGSKESYKLVYDTYANFAWYYCVLDDWLIIRARRCDMIIDRAIALDTILHCKMDIVAFEMRWAAKTLERAMRNER